MTDRHYVLDPVDAEAICNAPDGEFIVVNDLHSFLVTRLGPERYDLLRTSMIDYMGVETDDAFIDRCIADGLEAYEQPELSK